MQLSRERKRLSADESVEENWTWPRVSLGDVVPAIRRGVASRIPFAEAARNIRPYRSTESVDHEDFK